MNFNSPEYLAAFQSVQAMHNSREPFLNNKPEISPQKPYPVNAFPPLLRDLITSLHQDTGMPLEMIGSVVLAATTFALQPLIDVLSPHSSISEPCSLYMLTTALSGEGKTTINKLIMKPFYDFITEMKSEYQFSLEDYKKDHRRWDLKTKALESSFRQAVKYGDEGETEALLLDEHLIKEPKKPKKFNFLYEDATPKAMIKGLDEYPYGGIFSDEAITFFRGYAKDNLGLLNRAWGGDIYIWQRPDEEDIELNAHLTLLLMIQPGLFIDYVKKHGTTAIESGFFSRFLFTQSSSTIGKRLNNLNHAASDKCLERFHYKIKEKLIHQKNLFLEKKSIKETLKLSDDAKQLFIEQQSRYQENIHKDKPLHHINEIVSKSGSNAIRIASVFHSILGLEGDIECNALLSAYELIDWHLLQTSQLFYPFSEQYHITKDTIELFEWIKQYFEKERDGITYQHITTKQCTKKVWEPYDPFPKRDIEIYGPSRLRRAENLNPVLSQLIALKLIDVINILPNKTDYIVRLDLNEFSHPTPHGVQGMLFTSKGNVENINNNIFMNLSGSLSW